jgi:hypothetical protein
VIPQNIYEVIAACSKSKFVLQQLIGESSDYWW